MIYKKIIAEKINLKRQDRVNLFCIGFMRENKAGDNTEIENKISILTPRSSIARLISLYGIFGVIFFGLSLLAINVPKVKACEVTCGQVNTVGALGNPSLDPGANCKYDFGVGTTYKACIVNINSAGGLLSSNSRCADNTSINACDTTQCPTNLHVGNGANCTIMSSKSISSVCLSDPLTTDGKWDASEGKCVKCSGQMEDRVYNISGNNFTDTDIVNRCESACGGPASRDELASCVVASCVVNPPTIVSISPASYTGPAGGTKVYTIKAINNNTDCNSFSINFTASLNSDLTADWIAGGSTGAVMEGSTGTTTITITAKGTATPGTKNFTMTAFPHDNGTGMDYAKTTISTANYTIPALPVEICNDPAVADEDGNGLANCADTAACPNGTSCNATGGKCQAGACVAIATQPCSGSAMFTSPLGTSCSIRQILAVAIKWILALAGGLLLLIVIISGIKYISSAGDEERLSSAKRMLFYGIIGFAIILLAYELTTDVANVL